ncbi:MAG TPA: hypothetical protein VGL38_08560 [bacterium]
MTLADRMTLTGIGIVAAVFGLALWSLGGKRPHVGWLEYLQSKRLGPRQRIMLVISLFVAMVVIIGLFVHVMTSRPAL